MTNEKDKLVVSIDESGHRYVELNANKDKHAHRNKQSQKKKAVKSTAAADKTDEIPWWEDPKNLSNQLPVQNLSISEKPKSNELESWTMDSTRKAPFKFHPEKTKTTTTNSNTVSNHNVSALKKEEQENQPIKQLKSSDKFKTERNGLNSDNKVNKYESNLETATGDKLEKKCEENFTKKSSIEKDKSKTNITVNNKIKSATAVVGKRLVSASKPIDWADDDNNDVLEEPIFEDELN